MTGVVAASYDAYFVMAQLAPREQGVTTSELHSIAYLACLLSVYDGLDPERWRYGFTSTAAGAPFAAILDEALVVMGATGAMEEVNELLALSDRGQTLLADLERIPSLASRKRYLLPACNVTLALPLPTVTEAVVNEPQLRSAVGLGQARNLLDEGGQVLVGEHFNGLRSVLTREPADHSDLLVMAIVWLTYLSQQQSPRLEPARG